MLGWETVNYVMTLTTRARSADTYGQDVACIVFHSTAYLLATDLRGPAIGQIRLNMSDEF